MRKVLRSTQHTTHPPLVGFRLFALKCGRSGHEKTLRTWNSHAEKNATAFNFSIYRLSSSLKTESDSFIVVLFHISRAWQFEERTIRVEKKIVVKLIGSEGKSSVFLARETNARTIKSTFDWPINHITATDRTQQVARQAPNYRKSQQFITFSSAVISPT